MKMGNGTTPFPSKHYPLHVQHQDDEEAYRRSTEQSKPLEYLRNVSVICSHNYQGASKSVLRLHGKVIKESHCDLPIVRSAPTLNERSIGRLTIASFNCGGILLTRCRGSLDPKLASSICREIAAFNAKAGYAGYIKRSSLCGCAVNIPNHR